MHVRPPGAPAHCWQLAGLCISAAAGMLWRGAGCFCRCNCSRVGARGRRWGGGGPRQGDLV